jgi:hypothetical protein
VSDANGFDIPESVRRKSVTIAEIAAAGLRSPEELLAWLPEVFKTQFVLMEESRSRHRASPAKPRLIMFNDWISGDKDNGIAIAMSTDPDDPNFNDVELIEFDRNTSAYEFRDLVFTDGRAAMSEKNPALCQTCHQASLRPNWEPYNHWPGALGLSDAYTEEELGRLRAVTSDGRSPRLAALDVEQHIAGLGNSVTGTPAFALDSAFSKFQVDRNTAMLTRAVADGSASRREIMAALLDCEGFPERFSDRDGGAPKLADLLTDAGSVAAGLNPNLRDLFEYARKNDGISEVEVAANLEYLLGDAFDWNGFGHSLDAPLLNDVTNGTLSSLMNAVYRDLYTDAASPVSAIDAEGRAAACSRL